MRWSLAGAALVICSAGVQQAQNWWLAVVILGIWTPCGCTLPSASLGIFVGTVVGVARYHLAPQLQSLVSYNTLEVVPSPPTFYVLWNTGLHHQRRLGASQFTRQAFRPLSSLPMLSEDQREAYFAEGYLVLRQLVPPATVVFMREELLATLGSASGFEPLDVNAWLLSDALLDFLIFGPFGYVASQLFGGEAAHLMFLIHRYRGAYMAKSTATHHLDGIECEDGYPPARDTLRAKVKFYIPLFDNMPAMWILNESAFERLLSADSSGEEQRAAFREGRMTLDDVLLKLNLLSFAGKSLSWRKPNMTTIKALDVLSLKPLLHLGDVIVHSPCILHRTADDTGGRPSLFLAPTFARPATRFVGSSLVYRICDSGVSGDAEVSTAPPLLEVPRPSCFPRAYPLDDEDPSGSPLHVSYREDPRNYRWNTYYRAREVALEQLENPHLRRRLPLELMEVPRSNEVHFATA